MSRKFMKIFDGNPIVLRREKKVFIGFGSNEGHRRRQIEQALALVAASPGIRLIRVSSLYQTEPVGGPNQRDHFNGVAELNVTLSPTELLKCLKRIERNLGRRSGKRWGPRPIDLDILTFGNLKLDRPHLHVPHPLYPVRRFVLVPFAEIAPTFVHPLKKKTNRLLLRQLTPHGQRVTMLARWKNGRFYPFKRKKVPAAR
jgi:2-amino-4-hydroxy-6-hydroxymethyldihydropteridine diphosphokinase